MSISHQKPCEELCSASLLLRDAMLNAYKKCRISKDCSKARNSVRDRSSTLNFIGLLGRTRTKFHEKPQLCHSKKLLERTLNSFCGIMPLENDMFNAYKKCRISKDCYKARNSVRDRSSTLNFLGLLGRTRTKFMRNRSCAAQ